MKASAKLGIGVVLLLMIYVFGTGTSFPQESETLNADGTQVLPDLLDAEQAFQIARVAAENGDNQTAIVALERVLLINPNLGNIKFELGLLYRNVGAKNRAIFYLTESLKDDSMPESIRQRVDNELLALRGEDQQARGQFFGSLSLSGQYDSNALSQSDFKQVNIEELGGVDVAPTDSEDLGSDTSFRANAGAGYRNRFGRQGNYIWNSTLNVFTSLYSEFTDENEVGASIRSSLEMPLASDEGRVSVIPFLRATYSEDSESEIVDEKQKNSIGVGVTLRKSERNYSSLVTVQTTEDEDDYFTVASAGLSFQYSDTVANNFSLSIGSNNGTDAVEDFSFYSFGYSLTKRLRMSTWSRPAVLRNGFNVRLSSYDELNLRIDPENLREDEQISLFTTASFPFNQRLTGTVGLRWLSNSSTIINNDYENSQFSVGLNWRFD